MSLQEIAIAVVERVAEVGETAGYEYLIGQRPAGVALAGLWEFPGGKAEPGEALAVAAARECLEETGLAVDVGARHAVVEHQYAHATVRLSFFACRLVQAGGEPIPPFRWVRESELSQYVFPSANAPLLALLAAR